MNSSATKIKTLPVFSIPITIANFGVEAEELNRSLIADSIEEQKKDPITSKRSAVDGWQSKMHIETRYESFNLLKQNIFKVICSFLPHYGFTHDQTQNDSLFTCYSLWVNILTNRSAYHRPHIHGSGETLFSGVYYPTSGLTHDNEDYYPDEDWNDVELRATQGEMPGDLILFDPSAALKTQVIPSFVRKYPYYGHDIYIKPKKSHLIVFPNYLTHMVAPITADNYKRMSISFSFAKVKYFK